MTNNSAALTMNFGVINDPLCCSCYCMDGWTLFQHTKMTVRSERYENFVPSLGDIILSSRLTHLSILNLYYDDKIIYLNMHISKKEDVVIIQKQVPSIAVSTCTFPKRKMLT